jgi:hypothetical protein
MLGPAFNPASLGLTADTVVYFDGSAFASAVAIEPGSTGTHLTVTAQSATDVPVRIVLAASQTADALKVVKSNGTSLLWRVTANGTNYFNDDGSARAGTLSYSDSIGSWRIGRSDHSNYFQVAPADGTFTLWTTISPSGGGGVNGLIVNGANGTVVVVGVADGSHSTVDLNRRPTDDHPLVGGSVRCWTRTGQAQNAFEVLAPGGASATFAVGPAGQLKTANVAAATTPGAVTGKLELFDETGASLGFLAIYDAIT